MTNIATIFAGFHGFPFCCGEAAIIFCVHIVKKCSPSVRVIDASQPETFSSLPSLAESSATLSLDEPYEQIPNGKAMITNQQIYLVLEIDFGGRLRAKEVEGLFSSHIKRRDNGNYIV